VFLHQRLDLLTQTLHVHRVAQPERAFNTTRERLRTFNVLKS